MPDFGVSDLTVTFGDTHALDDVSVAVPRGQVTALVGGDGAGKSTLLRVMASLVAPNKGDVHTLPDRQLGYQPSTSGVWGNLSVLQNLDFVGRSFGMSGKTIAERSKTLLAHAGLTKAKDRLGRDLSGGMRQKLGFLMAILHEPELVLLDEPSTGVDPVSRVELWRLISETAVGNTAVLMTTTYLDEAQRAATVTALDRGSVIAAGTPSDVIAQLPGQIVLSDEVSVDSWRRGTKRHEWLPEGGATKDVIQPDLEDTIIALTLQRHHDPTDPSQFEVSKDGAPASGTVLASGSHVTRRFGENTAVDDVSLEVKAGEIFGLIGANGAGKTTFIRSLIGLDSPTSGTVELFGTWPGKSSRKRLGYVPQGLGLYQTITVAENAEFYSRVFGTPLAELPPELAELAKRPVSDIGLGLQRQLAFTLALSHRPELLVLDEPTSGVDPLSRARLWDVIHAQADANRGVLVTTHYMQEAEQCTKLALLSHGKLIGVGTVDELTAGLSALSVSTEDWQEAFTKLSEAGLPTMLDGRKIRVAGVEESEVTKALGGMKVTIVQVPPTLEEAMVVRESGG